jgi:DNA-binding IscR family transcriptional regulator
MVYRNIKSNEFTKYKMQQDTRLARLLHVLIHMHLRGGATTSETIAQMLHTNPALVRRTMASLRDAGYVRSERGPGGGWQLSCALADVTVEDVYIALSRPSLFAFGPAADNASCPVEAVVNAHLMSALGAAETALLEKMGETRLSDLAEQIRRGSGATVRS